MSDRLRTALAEAIADCEHHNREYKYVTPHAKILEWQQALSEASVSKSDRAELAALRRLREALVKLRDQAAHVDTDVARSLDVVLEMSEAPVEQPQPSKPAEQLRAGDHGYKLGAHRARTIDALLTAIDRDVERGGTVLTEADAKQIGVLAQAVATLAGAPL